MSHHPVVIHVDTDYIRAAHGVGELFTRPTLVSRVHFLVVLPPLTPRHPQTVKACYGVPSSASSSKNGNGEPNVVDLNGDTSMAEPTAASSESRSEWLVGEQLDKALAANGGNDKIEVRWPFLSDSEPQDWEGREFVL